eukprot:gene10954-12780_t
MSVISKIPDDILNAIPLGDVIKPIAVYRPEDFMYHRLCSDPDRLVQELAIIPNMGNLVRYLSVLNRIKATKSVDILALGGSITAGGYFNEFARSLEVQDGLKVTTHNHGHGATEIQYSIFCVDIEKYSPDIVLIDFSVNDYGPPKLMDSLIRRVLSLPSRPIVVIVDLWVRTHCGQPRYILHSFYYSIPIIDVCPGVVLCYGRHHPKDVYEQYSLTDGVHPWGKRGVPFLGEILYAWYKKMNTIVSNDVTMSTDGKQETHTHSFDNLLTPSVSTNSAASKAVVSTATPNVHTSSSLLSHTYTLPPPLYTENPIGLCTRCDALTNDADSLLTPIQPPVGFRKVTRMKIGYGGFTASVDKNDKYGATKSFRKSWQADTPGSNIVFKFFGSTVKIAIWQRRDGMGVIHAHVDDNKNRIAKASGFFKGYTWAMEKNNTGRSEIMTLFDDLPDTQHTLTLTVSNEPANVWVKGHLVQVFALLSASDHLGCKNMTLV